jgi:hypothetical protein
MPFARAFLFVFSKQVASHSTKLRVVKTGPLVIRLLIRMLRVCICGVVLGRNKINGMPTGHWWKVFVPPAGHGSATERSVAFAILVSLGAVIFRLRSPSSQRQAVSACFDNLGCSLFLLPGNLSLS